MSTLVWIHEDSLSPRDPALMAHLGCPAVFVWDNAVVEAEGYSLKRIVFQYECLLEMPVTIHHGPTLETLLRIASEHGTREVAVTHSVNPRFAEVVERLERELPVTVYAPEAMIPPDLEADLRRFARFWRRAEPYAFRKTER